MWLHKLKEFQKWRSKPGNFCWWATRVNERKVWQLQHFCSSAFLTISALHHDFAWPGNKPYIRKKKKRRKQDSESEAPISQSKTFQIIQFDAVIMTFERNAEQVPPFLYPVLLKQEGEVDNSNKEILRLLILFKPSSLPHAKLYWD